MNLSAFKAYDVRGRIPDEINADLIYQIGRAYAAFIRPTQVAVGRDIRLTSEEFAQALIRGLTDSGVNVLDIGLCGTEGVYFATFHWNLDGGIMITASHNPPDYNGLKMVIAGATLAGDDIQALKTRIDAGTLSRGEREGTLRSADIAKAYIDRIAEDVRLARPLRIAVDCGNGVAGAYAPELFRRLGCDVTELYCEVDGHFPNHHPDPSQPKNLQALIACLAASDNELGLAFDGDGDRLGVVTKSGAIIYPDRQLMLFAADVLSRNPGAMVIYDVKSTRNLHPWITRHGGKPLMWKTGHSLIKSKMKETGALLAGEMSGHTFFKERWYGFDDGMYAAARLLEILSRHADASAVLESLPDSLSTPELNVASPDASPHATIDRLAETARFPGAREVIRIDGLRVEYPDGFGLARASNTTPVIVLRFEADDPSAMERIQGEFRRALGEALPGRVLPF